MLSILPCKDEKRLKSFPEDTTLLIYNDGTAECASIAYRHYMSSVEILSLEIENTKSDRERFLIADGLVRSVGSIALNEGIITLCTKGNVEEKLLEQLGFFRNGEFYSLYLNKLFTGVCKGCKECK